MSDEPSTELVVAPPDGHAEQSVELARRAVAAPVSIVPDVSPAELVQRIETIQEAMRIAMREGVDYGVIPGTGSKPTLLKPGAEKLNVLFRLDCQTTHEQVWAADGHHLTVTAHTVVFSQLDGTRLGSGEGLCTTRERKYGVRHQDRTCPACGKPTVIKGKKEYGGGWACFKKKGGCGATWPDNAQQIVSQQVGDVENPDMADTYNTVVKMARKRAMIDAVLLVTGASAIFTQDMERDASAETPASAAPVPARLVEPVVLVSDETVGELVKCANGLTSSQIRLAFGAVGLGSVASGPINRETLRSVLADVPQGKSAALAQKLSGVQR